MEAEYNTCHVKKKVNKILKIKIWFHIFSEKLKFDSDIVNAALINKWIFLEVHAT